MDDKKKDTTPDLLQILDDFKGAVELFTGFKMQFINAGWLPEHAELMVIEITRSGNITASKQKE